MAVISFHLPGIGLQLCLTTSHATADGRTFPWFSRHQASVRLRLSKLTQRRPHRVSTGWPRPRWPSGNLLWGYSGCAARLRAMPSWPPRVGIDTDERQGAPVAGTALSPCTTCPAGTEASSPFLAMFVFKCLLLFYTSRLQDGRQKTNEHLLYAVHMTLKAAESVAFHCK